MSKEPILATPQQDLCAVVANAPKNGEIVLAPGKYVLNRPLVVDKTILMRSQTGKADDVTIERDNATVLFVIDGKPTFQGIAFHAPAASDDAPAKTNEYDSFDAFAFKSAVAVREKGNATFVECKASSRQKSAFSARGKKAFITLDKCRVPHSGEGGIFADDKAGALVKNSLIQNTRLGCVDVESKGSKITVENSSLERSEYAALVAHDDGLIVARNCKINAGESLGAHVLRNGRVEIEDSTVLSDLRDDTCVNPNSSSFYGVLIQDGSAKLTNCRASNLVVGVFMDSPNACLEMKSVDFDQGTFASLVYDERSPKIKISNCNLAQGTLEIKEFAKLLEHIRQKTSIAKWDPHNFSKEQRKRAHERKTQYFEKILGKEYPRVGRSHVPFYKGGALDLYFYVNTRYGGSFFLTKNLASPEFSRPSTGDVDAFELAIGTKTPFYLDAKGNTIPEYEKKYNDLFRKLSVAARKIWDDSSISRYETVEISDDARERYFIFDFLDEPELLEINEENQSSLTAYAAQSESSPSIQRTLSLDDALQMYSESESDPTETSKEERTNAVQRSFAVVVMIEIYQSEADYVDEHEGAAEVLMTKLKEQKRWPLSDLDRPPIF